MSQQPDEPGPFDLSEYATSDEILDLVHQPDGQIEVRWPAGMQTPVSMTPEVLQQWVDNHNDLIREVATLRTFIAIVRLGRRPSQKDWASVGIDRQEIPDG